MNRNIKSVGVLVSLLLLLLVGIAQATPDVPNLLYGDVTINCADAPTGTVIEAYIDGTLRGTITTDIVGEYGTSGIKLSVLGDSATEEDAVISFTINGITAVETILWQPMADVRELGLSTICATPGVAIISIDDASADSGLTSTTP
ncbi:MAG: hypothetical protein MIO93_14260, partial [ANME-2 cluster archaeon]|nr:hypothetical protein [ANME-2 cluster archaeon]